MSQHGRVRLLPANWVAVRPAWLKDVMHQRPMWLIFRSIRVIAMIVGTTSKLSQATVAKLFEKNSPISLRPRRRASCAATMTGLGRRGNRCGDTGGGTIKRADLSSKHPIGKIQQSNPSPAPRHAAVVIGPNRTRHRAPCRQARGPQTSPTGPQPQKWRLCARSNLELVSCLLSWLAMTETFGAL